MVDPTMHTFSSIYIHVVFATWSRRPYFTSSLRPRLHEYLAATARNLGLSDVDVGGFDDHVHLLARFDPTSSPSYAIGALKQSTSQWVRRERPDFRWQRGFGAFSVSTNRVPLVVDYIRRQEEHHRRQTFEEELARILEEHGVSLDAVGLL